VFSPPPPEMYTLPPRRIDIESFRGKNGDLFFAHPKVPLARFLPDEGARPMHGSIWSIPFCNSPRGYPNPGDGKHPLRSNKTPPARAWSAAFGLPLDERPDSLRPQYVTLIDFHAPSLLSFLIFSPCPLAAHSSPPVLFARSPLLRVRRPPSLPFLHRSLFFFAPQSRGMLRSKNNFRAALFFHLPSARPFPPLVIPIEVLRC